MGHEVGLDDGWQHRDPVLVSLTPAHDDLVGVEGPVLDPPPTALERPEPGPVEQTTHQAWHAVELSGRGAGLLAGQDGWQALGALRADDAVEPWEIELQHVTVQEEQRAQRLVLGRGGHLALDRERAQEPGDLCRAHFDWMALAVEDDVSADPRDVGVLSAATVVASAKGSADTVGQTPPRSALGSGVADGQRTGLAPLPGGADRSRGLTPTP